MSDAPQSSSSGSPEMRRKERIAMAREICLHKGENPNFIDRKGCENWEKYEPLAGACIREAERLFALRAPAQGSPDCGALANRIIADPKVIWLRECGFNSSARFESELRAAIIRACSVSSTNSGDAA